MSATPSVLAVISGPMQRNMKAHWNRIRKMMMGKRIPSQEYG